jgi:hypothetical protein
MKQSICIFLAALVALGLAGCAAPSAPLMLEEHALSAAPGTDSFSFQPAQGTQEGILAAHAAQRAAIYSIPVNVVDGNLAIASLGENGDLTAALFTAPDTQEQTVKVVRGDREVFATSAGMPSPVLPLQGLWTYNGHWALEILLADQDTWAGQVFIDGKLVNDAQKYDEAFGFQLLAGRPFFFFSRGGKIGYSYDGRETDLGYDRIPHYQCCSESVQNPIQAKEMVAFFALRGETWYYVELGDFGK